MATQNDDKKKADEKKKKKKKAPPKDPKDAPLGDGLAERAKQRLLEREAFINSQIDGE